MKNLLTLILVCYISALFAESKGVMTDQEKKGKAAAFQKKIKESYYKNTGGRIVNPKTGEGKIVIYNLQSRTESATFQRKIDELSLIFAVKIEVASGKKCTLPEFDEMAKKSGGAVTFFVVDDDSLPISLVAYENGWGMVNVAKFGKTSQDILLARLEKEIARTMALTCGIGCGMGTADLMKCVRDVNSLDACILPSDRGSLAVTTPIHRYLEPLGLLPITVTTYARACREGWAPAPTNDVQKALWEKAKVQRERGPSDPIKIVPKK